MTTRLLAGALLAACVSLAFYLNDNHAKKRVKQIESACFNGGYILDKNGEKYLCTYLGKITDDELRKD
jgi:hypothetical protein